MKISKDFAYFIGAMQADGYFYNFFHKKRGSIVPRIKFCVGKCSIEMLKQVQNILKKEFNRNVTIYEYNKFDESLRLETSIKHLLPLFNSLKLKFKDPPIPPRCVLKGKELFGAYLAGLIDGDGNICIKRKKNPQCRIRISSGKAQNELAYQIRKFFGCSVGIYRQQTHGFYKGREIRGTGYNLEFYISNKNKDKLPNSLLDYISIKHKYDTLIKFLDKLNQRR